MHKKIIFLLLVTNTISHGMETTTNDEKQAQLAIDAYILEKKEYSYNHYQAAFNLAIENKFSNELKKNKKKYLPICQKINRLCKIASDPHQQFNKEDLDDTWYINASSSNKTLLTLAYTTKDIQKIKDLINAGADVRNNINNNLLHEIVEKRTEKKLNTPERVLNIDDGRIYLKIAKLLLKNGANPDLLSNTSSHQERTLLMCTLGLPPICLEDKEYAHLLLWYNADPYKTVIIYRDLVNAFDLNKSGWLKSMFDEKQRIIFNCWLFKHHDFKEHTLIPDIIKFIKYKVWKVCKIFKTTHLPTDQSVAQ